MKMTDDADARVDILWRRPAVGRQGYVVWQGGIYDGYQTIGQNILALPSLHQ
jgi:hypothetical protein